MRNIFKYSIILLFLSTALFSQDLSGVKICLDPGHGGHESDDRHMVATDFWESESNLTKGLHLKQILESFGATVYITRTGNSNVADDPALSERVGMANEYNVDYFVSIHSNGYDGTANYTMSIFNGESDDPRIPESKVMSVILADCVYEANRTTRAVSIGDLTLNPSWTYGYGVLYPANMPANISEGSFHDYIPESWRLMNLDYRKKESWAIAKAIVNYFEAGEISDQHMLSGLVRSKYETVDYYYKSSLQDQYLPINQAKINIYPTDSPDDSITYITDDKNNGFFNFDSLQPGDYKVFVTTEDYYPDSATVTITDKLFHIKDFTLVSKVPPIVEETTPADNESSFPAWDPIKIKFSRSMDTLSVRENLTISPDAEVQMIWQKNNTVLWIVPDSLQFETLYTITLSDDMTDNFNHNLDGNTDGTAGGDYSFSFTTTPPDIDPPEVLSSYPGLGSSDVEINPIINITFNELIADSTLTEDYIKLEDFETKTYLPIDISVIHLNDKTGISIIPQEDLHHDNLYVTRLLPGIIDSYGNATTAKESYSFQTGTTEMNISTIDNFESGVDANWWQPGQSGSIAGTLPDLTFMTVNNDTTNPLSSSTAAMKINYGWDKDSDEGWLIREYLAGGSPRSKFFNKERYIQAFVYGDGSMNKFRFALDDDDNGHEVSPWYTLNWIGWKLVSWHMADNETGEWIGDGSLDGDLRVDSFQLTYDSSNETAATTGFILIDDFRLVTLSEVGTDNPAEKTPKAFTLNQNFPNPFNPTTKITFQLPTTEKVALKIYNIRGELVKTYAMGKLNQGNYIVTWDALDNNGMPVSAGTYIYQITYNGKQYSKKMLYLK